MLDYTAPGALRLVADQIADGIETHTARPAKYSWRIKPSKLNGECVAEIWYGFRWVSRSPIEGQSARRMDRGTDRENSLVRYLRQAGWVVYDIDPSKEGKKFNQWNFTALDGHVSAYLDGKMHHKEFFGGAEVLLELKTMAKGRFGRLFSKRSLMVTEPEYYGQIQIYMDGYNLDYCVFFAECQDTQEIYVEVVRRDPLLASRLLMVAETIKNSRVRPSRVAQSPTYHKCKSCEFLNVCHYDANVDRNCRSCVNAIAAQGGKFYCDKWKAFIPGEKEILAACPHHEPVK
jgi:hypothetical protein